ncbi:MAG: YihA family ribosome biogenesis GTP-binding protein [Clostridia bacterium]|nr:YihA family ribosome biogenesis GTP-binding protein [Clostridia bacterium]
MRITESKFITSFASPDKYVEYSQGVEIPEICVVGRSNVGKSTFINTFASRSKLAKTSSTPGRTRLINVFDFNNGLFRLVDLPGYGYAQAGKQTKQEWGNLIEGYLQRSRLLKHTFVLVDARHEPTKLDLLMVEYLYYYRMPFTVIATKCDKLSRAQVNKSLQVIATTLKMGKDNIIATDMTGTGRDKVCAHIEKILATPMSCESDDEVDEE